MHGDGRECFIAVVRLSLMLYVKYKDMVLVLGKKNKRASSCCVRDVDRTGGDERPKVRRTACYPSFAPDQQLLFTQRPARISSLHRHTHHRLKSYSSHGGDKDGNENKDIKRI